MRSRNLLTLVLGLVAPILLVDVAQAYYTPGLGRFINRDPYYELGGPNLHAYVGNDPISYVDPLGLQAATSQAGCCPCDQSIGKWSASLIDAGMLQANAGVVSGIVGRPDHLASKFDGKYTIENDCWKNCCSKLGMVQVACERWDDTGQVKCRLDQASGPKPWYSTNSVSTTGTVSMSDTPGYVHASKLEQYFVVCAVCEKSDGSKTALSCIKWGHKFHKNSSQKLGPNQKQHTVYSAHRWLQDDEVWGWHAVPDGANVGDPTFTGTGPDGKRWMSPKPKVYTGPGVVSPVGLDPMVDYFKYATGVSECKNK